MSINEYTLIEASTESLKAFADLIRYNIGKTSSLISRFFLEKIKFTYDGNAEKCIYVTCYREHSKVVNAIFRGSIFATETAKSCEFYINGREFINAIESAILIMGEGVICIDIGHAKAPSPVVVIRSSDGRFKKQIRCVSDLSIDPGFLTIEEAYLPGFNDDAFGVILKTNELEQAMTLLADALPALEDNILGLVGIDFAENGKAEIATTDGSRLHAAIINCAEIPNQPWTSLDKLIGQRLTISPVAIKNAIYMSKRIKSDHIVLKFKKAEEREDKKQFSKGIVTLTVGSAFTYDIYSTWIGGDYPKWQKLINEDDKLTTGFLVDLNKMHDVLLAIKSHANLRTNYVAVYFKDGKMNIMAKDYSGNSACAVLRKSECKVYRNSPKQQQNPFFCINVFYMLNVIRAMIKLSNTSGYILFAGNDAESKDQVMNQILFMPEKISNIEYKALIMPVQIKLKEDLDPDNYCEWFDLSGIGESGTDTNGADS